MASVDPNHDTLFVFSSSDDKSSGGYKNEACILKKNQNTPRPSEHPPVRGIFFFKTFRWDQGCKYKTSSWHLNGFPDGSNIGSTV